MLRIGRTGTLVLTMAALAVWCGGEEPKLTVPYVPTPNEAVDAMLDMANVTDKDVVYDLGCGDGRIVVRAAKYRGARGVGVDLNPERIEEANENAKTEGVTEKVEFRVQDLLAADVRPATVVAIYLLPRVNLQLRPKLFAELQPGARVVSHSFNMGEWEADRSQSEPRTLYYWVIPAGVGGTWRWSDAGEDAAQDKGGAAREGHAVARIEQEFQTLHGKVEGGAGPGGMKLLDGKVHGRDITLTVAPRGDSDLLITYTGTLDDDTIKGTQEWKGGAGPERRPWLARREPVKLAGDWEVKGPGKQTSGKLHLEQEQGAWRARFKPSGAEEAQPVPAVYVWGASVRFELGEAGPPVVFTGLFDEARAEGRVDTGETALAAAKSGARNGVSGADTSTRWTAERIQK